MSKKECDIIKDLLPSYVDEICSEASKEWIEEHLADCEECKKTVAMLKNTEFSARRLEQESLDAGRRVIRQNLRRSMVGLGLCFLLLLVIFFTLNYEGYYGRVPVPVLYAALPVCMVMTWLVSRNQTKLRPMDKWDIGSSIVALIGMGYGIVLLFFVMNIIKSGDVLPVPNIGPVLNGQMVTVIVLCFGLYMAQMARTIKQGRAGSVVVNVCLLGVFVMLGYCLQLGNMSDLKVATTAIRTFTLSILGIGVVGTVVLAFLDKRAR